MNLCTKCNHWHNSPFDCPSEQKPREWFIGWPDGENLEEVYDNRSGGVHVIEKSAYDAVVTQLERVLADYQKNDPLHDYKAISDNRIKRLDRALEYAKQTWADHPAKSVFEVVIDRIVRGEE